VKKNHEWWIYYGGADKYIGASKIAISLSH